MESGAGKDTGGVMTLSNEVVCSRCAGSRITARLSTGTLSLVLERDNTVVILDSLGKRPRHGEQFGL